MPLLTIVIILVIVGVGLYLINTYVPMAANIKRILNWVVVIVVILWLFSLFGLFHYVSGLHT